MIDEKNITSSHLDDRLLLWGSRILFIQNAGIIVLYLIYRFIGGSIDPPWFTIPAKTMNPLFYLDLIGFAIIILPFLIRGYQGEGIYNLYIAGAIFSWLILRMYWQFIYFEPLLPPFAYGKVRFLLAITYEYAIDTKTVYLFFTSGLLPYFFLSKAKKTNTLAKHLFNYFKIQLYAGTLLLIPQLPIINFVLQFQTFIAISFIIVLLLKFYMIILGFALFKDFTILDQQSKNR